MLGQVRSTQRHREVVANDEGALTERIIALAMAYGRYGYRRVTALLQPEGWRVNHKRRPHSALGYRPPAPEAVQVAAGLT